MILVEDILDTGLTMTYLKKRLMARQPKSSASPRCWTNHLAENSRSKRTTSVSAFPTSSWWATDWITLRSTEIFRIFASYRGRGNAMAPSRHGKRRDSSPFFPHMAFSDTAEVGLQGSGESDSQCTGCYHKDSWKLQPHIPMTRKSSLCCLK